MVEPEEPKIVEATRSEAVVETSKKMNKSERTTREKDVLDKILAEQEIVHLQNSSCNKLYQEHVEGKEQEKLEEVQ
ncbi:hypothetical protein OIU76_026807 [Salix suchowensis]|uniref:Uncharacterized protein n=1 Tax=Salix suchowensis TaxID=1278906 RepID=A0ABQ9ARA0_9ROSI|nr:hypothetical protein OIU77_005924 [Salix suchowensis]KAJ6372388.1 hypothetical protein OIU76_026807 [Salix suchowensis]